MAEHVGLLFKRARERLDLTQGQVAEYARVGRSWLSRVEIGDIDQPNQIMVEQVADYLGIPRDLALAAAGYRITPAPPPPEPTVEDLLRRALAIQERSRQASASREQEARGRVLLIQARPNVFASAGPGGSGEEVAPYPPRPEESSDEFTLIRTSGACMEPVVHDGDLVVVNLTCEPKPGDIVVAERGGEVLVKWLRRRNGDLFLEPNQPGYETLRVDEATRIIGVVRWSGRAH